MAMCDPEACEAQKVSIIVAITVFYAKYKLPLQLVTHIFVFLYDRAG